MRLWLLFLDLAEWFLVTIAFIPVMLFVYKRVNAFVRGDEREIRELEEFDAYLKEVKLKKPRAESGNSEDTTIWRPELRSSSPFVRFFNLPIVGLIIEFRRRIAIGHLSILFVLLLIGLSYGTLKGYIALQEKSKKENIELSKPYFVITASAGRCKLLVDGTTLTVVRTDKGPSYMTPPTCPATDKETLKEYVASFHYGSRGVHRDKYWPHFFGFILFTLFTLLAFPIARMSAGELTQAFPVLATSWVMVASIFLIWGFFDYSSGASFEHNGQEIYVRSAYLSSDGNRIWYLPPNYMGKLLDSRSSTIQPISSEFD